TTFDYKTTNAEGSKTYDKDTIWIPDWKDGAMNHTYTYANGTNFEFPKIAGTTFKAAYLDEACTQKIEDEFVHSGTLDVEHGVAVNRVQNIYIEVEQGEWYRIQTAEQLSLHGNPAGIYEIQADLDFDKGDGSYWEWPAAFEANTFTGKFYSADGHNYKIKNATALHISSTATFGGLFGKVAATAEIKNVTFENATFDLYATGVKLQDAEYGLFAGYIEEGASVSNVTLIGGTVRIGQVNWENGYSLNLVANGYVSGLQTTDKIKLQVYGMELMTSYYYAIDPTSVTVDEDFNVSMSAGYYDLTESSYDIEY
ncbi:MAG: hypothetical protein J6A63_04160, partial [Clostridia bacterium]|nr:hypothetical protein [Clostridia bacterium]